MNEYRKKLKIQIALNTVGIIALTVVQILSFKGIIAPLPDSGNFVDFLRGFIAGAAAGVSVLLLVGIIINIVALNKEEKLKKLYIKENDERCMMITLKGKSSGASICLCAMLIAAIICGYFSVTAFISVICCTVALALSMCFGKIYYSNKM